MGGWEHEGSRWSRCGRNGKWEQKRYLNSGHFYVIREIANDHLRNSQLRENKIRIQLNCEKSLESAVPTSLHQCIIRTAEKKRWKNSGWKINWFGWSFLSIGCLLCLLNWHLLYTEMILSHILLNISVVVSPVYTIQNALNSSWWSGKLLHTKAILRMPVKCERHCTVLYVKCFPSLWFCFLPN